MGKFCKTCGQVKDRSEFHKSKAKADGLQSTCKTCRREYNRNWDRKNKARKAEENRNWHAQNPMARRLKDGRARARANNLPAEVFSFADLEAHWSSEGINPDVDYITGEPLQDDWHLDHVVSLSDPNSPGHVLSNVRPCNASTNIAKGNQALADYQKELTHV